MERIDRLILKAQNKTDSKPKPWEQAMKKNPYSLIPKDVLLDLLAEPVEDWRQIVQACVW